jgi:hypothetical protein
VCPTCSTGIKPSRGWTWLDIAPFTRAPCKVASACPLERPAGRVGLLWVGEVHYATPAHFELEAAALGISRRISKVPRGFVLGETFVALAHRKAIQASEGFRSSIFQLFRPTRLELIVKQSAFEDTVAMDKLRMRGITPVPVPDDDPDHRGSGHDVEGDELALSGATSIGD